MPLYLYKEYAGHPAGTEITDFVISDLSTSDNKIYIATIEGKEMELPIEYTTIFKRIPYNNPYNNDVKEFDKDKALQLLATAERMMYDRRMISDVNEFKSFLQENGVKVIHSTRKCIACNEPALEGVGVCLYHMFSRNND